MKILTTLFAVATLLFTQFTTSAQIKIGAFADCQYCDSETAGSRYYRNSQDKLFKTIQHFNQIENLEFIANLGDLIDRDFVSFKTLEPILTQSEHKIFHVVGNHDFEVDEKYLEKVPGAIGMDKTYYTIEKKGWTFIFLNGNEITLNSNDPEIIIRAEEQLAKLKSENAPNAKSWNGGIGEKQILWLENQLKTAQDCKQKVALFCHYPLLPLESHSLWNAKELLNLLNNYSSVKLWVNGHNHAGNYTKKNGIHFVTLRAMVETEKTNAYSMFSFFDDKIVIEGFDREISRTLGF